MKSPYEKLVDAIKRGHIRSSHQAAEKFGVSRTTIANRLRMARAAGWKIATRTDGVWAIIGEPK